MGRLPIFDENSIFGRFCAAAGNVIIVNLLLVLTILPVVTAGAGLCAAWYCMLCQVRYGDIAPFGDFRRAFAGCWKKATAVWLMFLAAEGILFVDLRLAGLMTLRIGPAGGVCTAVISAVMLAVLFLALWSLPVLAAFEVSLKMLLRNSFWFSVKHLPVTLYLAVLAVGPLWLTFLFREWMPLWAFLWSMAGFAFLIRAGARPVLAAFRPYLESTDAEQEQAGERQALRDLKRMGG